MEKLDLNEPTTDKSCLIMIFTEGTILAPRSLIKFFNQKKYQPIKNCVAKITNWEKQGAEIIYLTSRRKKISAESTRDLLKHYGFPGSTLYYRSKREKYKNIVEKVQPNILIEDNCRSIGGNWQTAINKVEKPLKENITSIIVKEFGGIDHLPDNLYELTMSAK